MHALKYHQKIHKIQKNSEKRESFCGIIGLDKCVYWRYFHYLCCLLPWENWNLNKTRMYTKDFRERCSSCSGKGKSAIIYFSKAIFRSNKTHLYFFALTNFLAVLYFNFHVKKCLKFNFLRMYFHKNSIFGAKIHTYYQGIFGFKNFKKKKSLIFFAEKKINSQFWILLKIEFSDTIRDFLTVCI